MGNRDEDTIVLFIRADVPPVYSLHSESDGIGDTIPNRVVGLGCVDRIPPGCHNLMLAFSSQSDADMFVYACRNCLHLRYSTQHHIQIHNHISNNIPTEKLHEFYSRLPYKLAFEVEKTSLDSVLTGMEILSLKEDILSLQAEHGDDAPEIFRSFASELQGRSAGRTRHRKRRTHRQSSQENLPSLLRRVTRDFIREHQKPRPLLAPSPQKGPFPDQSNSVLRRYGHPECFLRVSFQDENRSKLHREADCSILNILKTRYRSTLLDGCRVAGRQFQFLGFLMSGLKEHSVWFVTPLKDENGKPLDAQSIRNNLMSRHWPSLISPTEYNTIRMIFPNFTSNQLVWLQGGPNLALTHRSHFVPKKWIFVVPTDTPLLVNL